MRSESERETARVSLATTIVGHQAPDLDCLTAIWILMRFGGYADAHLHFVAAGTTLDDRPVDSDPQVIHVDTGRGRYDHHQSSHASLCAAELVRRAVAPRDVLLSGLVEQVNRIDHATDRDGRNAQGFFNIQALVDGLNLIYPHEPLRVAQAMLPNLDAWYQRAARQQRLEEAFETRIEFETRWGLGIAMESADGASSRLAFRRGAVLYAYRDGQGWMGIAAQSRSNVNLRPVYRDLQKVDTGADWYLHPNGRLLLCGTAKAPPRHPSRLSLAELVRVIQGQPPVHAALDT
jgi:hypothetical protein